MRRFLLSIVQPDGPPPPPERLEPVMREVRSLVEAAKAAGVLAFTGGLRAADEALVVRAEGDELLVTDGPYLEAREHLGGLLIVEVRDREAALDWARQAARAIGLPIELREFQPVPEDRSGGSGSAES